MNVDTAIMFTIEARIAPFVESVESVGMNAVFGVEEHEFIFLDRIESPLASTL